MTMAEAWITESTIDCLCGHLGRLLDDAVSGRDNQQSNAEQFAGVDGNRGSLLKTE